MKPIHAYYEDKTNIKVDISDIDTLLANKTEEEVRIVNGIITDVLVLNQSEILPVKDGVITQEADFAFAVFWEDRGDHYNMDLISCNKLKVAKKEMHNYVAQYYSA